MADVKTITLSQLRASLERIKSYTEITYSALGHIHFSGEIAALTGYSIYEGEFGSDMHISLSDRDTLNVALGKIEKSIINIVENIESYKSHNHNDLYYLKAEIDNMVIALEESDANNLLIANSYTDSAIKNLVNGAPETLDTLREIADALGNDANLAATLTQQIGERVKGPASSTIDHVAVFSTVNGKEIKDSGYTIQSNVPGDAEFTDYKVTATANNGSHIYLAGTTSSSGGTGTLTFNSGIYINGSENKIVAPTFNGDLDGRAKAADMADVADVANKTQKTFTLSLNGEPSGVFNGSSDTDVNITPASIGAHDTTYTEKATDQEVLDMLTTLFG